MSFLLTSGQVLNGFGDGGKDPLCALRVKLPLGFATLARIPHRLMAPRGKKRNPAAPFWDGFWSLSPPISGSNGSPNASKKEHPCALRVNLPLGIATLARIPHRLMAPRGAKRNPSAVQFWDGFWSLSPRTAGSKGYPNATQKDHFGSTLVHLLLCFVIFANNLNLRYTP